MQIWIIYIEFFILTQAHFGDSIDLLQILV